MKLKRPPLSHAHMHTLIPPHLPPLTPSLYSFHKAAHVTGVVRAGKP